MATSTRTVEKHHLLGPPRQDWRRGFEDLPRQHGFEPLRVEGRIPMDLHGNFYWNGPGLLSAFGRPYGHWFDGDGAVGAVRFERDGVRGAVRLIETPSLVSERLAGRRLYSRLLSRSPRPLRERFFGRTRNPTNVNVVVHDGRLLALGIGRPMVMSEEDLATLGELDPSDVRLRSFCAHPHWHPGRRALYGFSSLMGKRTSLDVIELRSEGRRRLLTSIPIKAPSLVHDCAVTANHVILVVPPLRFRVWPMLLNLLPAWRALEWDADATTELVIVPIDNPDRVVRVAMPPFFSFHFANAYEEHPGRIVVDLPCSDGFARLGTWLEGIAQGRAVEAPDSQMRRIVVDLAAQTAAFEPLGASVGEMPRVSPRVETRRHRFIYHVGFRPGHTGAPDLLHKLDVVTGSSLAVELGRDAYPSEPVIVPRADGRAEDDAYLLTLVYDSAAHASHVAILDSARPCDGPLARVYFDHHVPFTFHGAWAPAASDAAN
jgi:all-trans-8'-apo-beta-carotenal 15,15'-oxygenase